MGTNRSHIGAFSEVVPDDSDSPEHRRSLEGEDPVPGIEAPMSCGCGSWWVVLGCWLAHVVSSIGLDHERPHENPMA